MVAHATVTLVDVATRAGVSLKTASRALNNEPHVAAATKQRVLDAATAMGFQLNPMASMLRRGIQSGFIGVVVGDLANPFYASLIKGIELEAREHDLRITVASTDEDPAREAELLAELVDRRAAGIILVSAMPDHAALAAMQERGVPLTFVDRAPMGLDADSVVFDNAAGAALAVRHLHAHGHRRIGFIGDFERLQTERERRAGFVDELAACGLALDPRYIREDAHDTATAERITAELLGLDTPPTAIFTGNNRITIGAVRHIANGSDRPAIVGFDDFELADVLGITVISYDTESMGRAAARQILDGGRPGEEGSGTQVVPVHLIARGSGERAPGEPLDAIG